MREENIPNNEVINAVFNPSSKEGMLAFIFAVSKSINPRYIPRNVPNIPRDITAPGASDTTGPTGFLITHANTRVTRLIKAIKDISMQKTYVINVEVSIETS